tara:strand:- start:74 stop:1069 length:996 start_codon:yes stop_codon:yes gene_type:complete
MYKNLSLNFKALFVKKEKKKFILSLGRKNINHINKNEVLIKVLFSSLNYKDILICLGNPGLIRKYPHIPGIDASGIVIKSGSKKFKMGDKVMVVAQPLGVRSNGGFSQFIKVPFNWVEKIPKNFSIKKSMIFGTAGFTATLAVMTLLKKKIKKDKPILVSGATGGVGVFSIYMLTKLGFSVVAVSTKNKDNFLKKLGAKEVISLKEFCKNPNLPLLKIKYAAIIDNIGGDIIRLGSKQLDNNGKILSIGMASGENINIGLMPFILRGIELIGINSENTDTKLRKKIWKNITKFSNDNKLNHIFKECGLSEISNVIKKIKLNKNVGRYIVKL